MVTGRSTLGPLPSRRRRVPTNWHSRRRKPAAGGGRYEPLPHCAPGCPGWGFLKISLTAGLENLRVGTAASIFQPSGVHRLPPNPASTSSKPAITGSRLVAKDNAKARWPPLGPTAASLPAIMSRCRLAGRGSAQRSLAPLAEEAAVSRPNHRRKSPVARSAGREDEAPKVASIEQRAGGYQGGREWRTRWTR